MKKILPILLAVIIAVSAVFSVVPYVHAQPLPTPDVAYTPDAEVNFVGKAAARSIQFLNWTLQNYTWQCFDLKDVTNASNSQTVQACDNSASPLIGFWSIIRNIVYAFFALFVLITAFVLITTRGRSLTIKRFLPRFIAVVLLVTFSYALLQFLYITTDIIQGFFLTKPPETAGAAREIISAKDLLYVGWDYENFVGLRKIHPYFDESVFVNLLLARLTAVTYYAMTGVLLIRKIILWFFIIVSPIFPVLLLYYPVRNTAKIWIGEFFRWLMYAPLFSVFLAGLVSLWKAGIPLLFHGFSDALSGKIIYPTATNILLGGPGQQVSINNNLNVPETFAQYVVALIMLWVVILLPFVLLQIFLDYLNNFSISESPAFQKIMNTSYSLLNKTPPPVPLGPSPSGPGGTTGVAKALPFARFGMAKQIPNIQDTGEAKELPFSSPIARTMAAQVNTEMLGAANIALPTIRDIVNYETAALRQDSRSVSNTYNALQKIANPQSIANPIEREKFVTIKDRLTKESLNGNSLANAVLSAVTVTNNISTVTNKSVQASNLKNNLTQIANPSTISSTVTSTQREHMTKLHDSLVKESQQGNTLATTVLSTTKETSTTQMQDLREKLVKESMNNNLTATNVLATTMSSVESKHLQQVIKEIANPQLASVTDRQKITELHDSLVKESEQGNDMATALLSSKEITSEPELQQIKEKLVDSSLQGNKTAGSVLATALAKANAETPITASLPQSNRVQSVSFEDYEAVKKMWQENYNNLEAPEGMNRAQWIKDDVKDIDGIIAMLSSTDEQQVQEGMQQVSNILPFLMLGGFSKEEIIGYLKAKGEAGKSVLEVVEKEEEDTVVTVEKRTTTQSATMAQSRAMDIDTGSSSDVDEASPLTQVVTRPVNVTVNNELLKLTNLPLPTMRDVVRFEQSMQSRDVQKKEEVTKMKDMLQQLANPSGISTEEDRKRVEDIRTKLMETSQQGDPLAASILHAANMAAGGQAAAGDTQGQTLPQENRVQTVSVEDYEAVRQMWEENYKGNEIPEGATDRQEWVRSEVQQIDQIVSLLSSSDQQQVQEGMQQVASILPFLMLGGFSQSEILGYLKAKQEAGKSVLKVIESEQNNEETMVTVNMQATPVQATQTQVMHEEVAPEEVVMPAPATIQAPVVNTTLLQSVNVPLPTIRDVVKYELALQAKDDIKRQEATHITETLGTLVNPEKVVNTEEKEKVQGMKVMLDQASGQGDVMADAILKASQHSYHGVDEQLSETLLLTLRQYLEEIAHPGGRLTETKEEVQREIAVLHEEVVQANQQGDPLAVNILTITTDTPLPDVSKIWEQMITAKATGSILAGRILGVLPEDLRQQVDKIFQPTSLPETNKIQTVSLDDYEAVRAMWEENFAKADLPTGESDRTAWVKKEIEKMQQVLPLLSSDDPKQQQAGIQQVSHILPFLLLGGFSLAETTTYLKAKLQAALSVDKTLSSEQQTEEFVSSQPAEQAQEMAMPLSPDAGAAGQTSGTQQNT